MTRPLVVTSVFVGGPGDHLQDPAADLLRPLGDPAVVDPVGADLREPREQFPIGRPFSIRKLLRIRISLS
jgi:hypothetical protein